MTPVSSASRVPIAAAPVTWNNNDLENWRPRIPFPEILDRIAVAGYSATEYDGSFGTDAATILAEAEKRGLAFCGAYQWLDLQSQGDVVDETPNLLHTFATLQAIGCNHLIIADALRPERVAIAGAVPPVRSASLAADGYRLIARNAVRVASAASEYDLHVHYHNHVGTYIEAPWEVEALLDDLDPIAVDLCFDTGHFAFGGGDPLEFVASHIAQIGYVHLKDVDAAALADAREKHWSFLESLRHYVFADIGTGIAQTDKILDLLVRRDVVPWIVIEQDTCAGDATEVAARNLSRVRAMIDASLKE